MISHFRAIPKARSWRTVSIFLLRKKQKLLILGQLFVDWCLLIKEAVNSNKKCVTYCQEKCGQKVMTAIPSFVISFLKDKNYKNIIYDVVCFILAFISWINVISWSFLLLHYFLNQFLLLLQGGRKNYQFETSHVDAKMRD